MSDPYERAFKDVLKAESQRSIAWVMALENMPNFGKCDYVARPVIIVDKTNYPFLMVARLTSPSHELCYKAHEVFYDKEAAEARIRERIAERA